MTTFITYHTYIHTELLVDSVCTLGCFGVSWFCVNSHDRGLHLRFFIDSIVSSGYYLVVDQLIDTFSASYAMFD